MCSKKQITLLYKKGVSKLSHPIKIIFNETPVDLKFNAQVMFVVPKRSFKKAHDRNKLKRRMREIYRLNKKDFLLALIKNEKKVIISFIYIGKKIEIYQVIESSMLKLLSEV